MKVMKVKNNTPGWYRPRPLAAGAGGKLATTHADVRAQASYGNLATGISIPMKMWNIQKIATWNVRGFLETGK